MARATNPIVQLAADAVPIFADPAREYYYVARVRRHRRIKGGVRLSVLTNEDEEMTLDLRFAAPEVLRVRAYPPGEEPPLTSPMLVDGAERLADVAVETVEGKVVLTTSALVLKVVPKPFHFGVFDRRGRKLFVQQIADVSFSVLVSLPLGYSRDAQGRVAFHESFELEPDERLFGLGQQYGPLDKRGQRVISWNRDARGTNTTRPDLSQHPLLPEQPGLRPVCSPLQQDRLRAGVPFQDHRLLPGRRLLSGLLLHLRAAPQADPGPLRRPDGPCIGVIFGAVGGLVGVLSRVVAIDAKL